MTNTDTTELLVSFTGDERDTLRALLICGHYSEPIFDRSSDWSHPREGQPCSEGCGNKAMDERLASFLTI